MQQQCQLYLLRIMCNTSYIVTFTEHYLHLWHILTDWFCCIYRTIFTGWYCYMYRKILTYVVYIYRVILLHVQDNIFMCVLYLQGDIATCTQQYLHVWSMFTRWYCYMYRTIYTCVVFIYRVILLHVHDNIYMCGLYLQGDIATCTGQYLHMWSIFTGWYCYMCRDIFICVVYKWRRNCLCRHSSN